MNLVYHHIWLPFKTFVGTLVLRYLKTNSRLCDSIMLFGLAVERLLAPKPGSGDNSGIRNINNKSTVIRGVNISGVLQGEFGMGKSGLSLIKSIEEAGIPYTVNYVDELHKNIDHENKLTVSPDNKYPVNIMHVNADCSHRFFARVGSSYFENRYNIGCWVWESDRIPEEWYDSFRYYDEIWVPTKFCQDAVSSVSTVPVVRVPISINIDEKPLINIRSKYGISAKDFMFLFVFDFYGSSVRKNPVGLIDAFHMAFEDNENVVLVLKYINHENFPAQYNEIRSKLSDKNNIKVVERHIKKEDLYSLYKNCDCYVSLHRAEGFGITMAEAMFLNRPVIATGYSGNMDFMNLNNSFLVKYDMVEIGEKEYPPYRKGYFWADPDLDHAAELMRYVYENPEESEERGRKASEDIKKNFSPTAIGEIIKKRLDMIYDSGLIEDE